MLALTCTSYAEPANITPCPFACQSQVDYQHPTTALSFSRVRRTAAFNAVDELSTLETVKPQAASLDTWRHRYDIVITQHGDNRIVFDQLGGRHVFVQHSDSSFNASTTDSGSLRVTNTGHQWINKAGVEHYFAGSYLTQLVFPETRKAPRELLKLRYSNRRLSSISDRLGNQIFLNQTQPGLVSLTTPDGDPISYAVEHCPEPGDVETATCDTAANPVEDFVSSNATENLTSASITYMDARPATCNSYFTDYFGAERGSQIESAVEHLAPYAQMIPTVRSFPIVDFIDGSALIVMRSRDLANSSFNDPANPNALLERLQRDGREIQTRLLDPLDANHIISHTELGRTTTIVKRPGQQVVLQLLIRHQIASPDHWRQIEQAKMQLLARHGIRLDVILIP